MKLTQIMNHVTGLGVTLALLISSALPVYAAELTQRHWMVTLVDTLGWSYGLPDEPQDPDYINILTGNRQFRFEAEDIYSRTEDNVSEVAFRNFGTFSGSGWLNGTRNATNVHLRFNLPLPGDYLVQANLRRAGHQFDFGGTTLTADAENPFTLVTLGRVHMQAGPQEILLTLPPSGAIDYITLTAPNLAVISPGQGWQPDEPLTWQAIQTTMLQLLHLAELFPSSPAPQHYEAEALRQTEVRTVTIPHLGYPSGGKWLRAGAVPATVRFPISLTESGFFDLSLRVMGDPINISIGDHQELELAAKTFLDDYSLQPLFLFAGNSNITLELPPGGGVDRLSLVARLIDNNLTATLLDLDHAGAPTPGALDDLTALLAAFGAIR